MKHFIILLLIGCFANFSYAQAHNEVESAATEETAVEYYEEAEAPEVEMEEAEFYHKELDSPEVNETNSLVLYTAISVTLFLALLVFYIVQKSKKTNSIKWDPFSVTGLFTSVIALYFGLRYLFGIYGAVNDIQKAGDISPAVIAGASRILFYSSMECLLYGLLTLFLGLISKIWFNASILNKASWFIIIIGALVTIIGLLSFVITPMMLNSLRPTSISY